MTYQSGRTKEQFIRLAVIEGRTAYVPPGLFAKMQETSINPTLSGMEQAEEQCRWLLLTHDEWTIAKISGFHIIVDYEMEDLKS